MAYVADALAYSTHVTDAYYETPELFLRQQGNGTSPTMSLMNLVAKIVPERTDTFNRRVKRMRARIYSTRTRNERQYTYISIT